MRTLSKIALILLISYSAYSQSLSVFDIDTSAFPTMKAKFFAFGADGKQITNYSTSDFKITENGTERTVTNVSCPAIPEPVILSIAISIDISGSMSSGEGGYPSVELGKTTATNLVNAFNMPPHDAAIQSCHATSFINQDFTTDKVKVLSAINMLKAGGDNDFVEHLLNPRTGILNIAKTGIHKKIAILCTDAWWYPLTANELQRCIDTCTKYGITFYPIIYSRKETEYAGIKVSLQAIADATGGHMYDGVIDNNGAKELANSLSLTLRVEKPCTIEWKSGYSCFGGITNLGIFLVPLKLTDNEKYLSPKKSIAKLDVKPTGIMIWGVPAGKTKDTSVVIKSINGDFNVSNIIGTNPNFKIAPTSFQLKSNESKTLTVTYTPTDSLINSTTFDVINDLCESLIFVRAGFPGQKQKNPSFKVTHPNGGEKFGVGTDTIITWAGCGAEELVKLEYSTDAGKAWNSITGGATGLKYSWKNIPNPPGNLCLLKASIVIDESTNDTNFIPLSGHTNDVRSVTYSPDGSKIASGSFDKTIRIWDVKTKSEIKTLKGHTLYVNCVSYSPDGTKIASASSDKTIKIWDANTGAEIKTLKGHTDWIYGVCFSPDGTKIASGSSDKMIKIWDVSTGTEIKNLTGHNDWVYSVSFCPDGNTLASSSEDNTIKLWDVNTGSEIFTLTGHTSYILSVSFSPDGVTLASGSHDNTIKIWDVFSGSEIRTLTGHNSDVNCVSFSPDGSKIASASSDKTIKLWNVNSGKEIRTLLGHISEVNSVCISPAGNKLVSGGFDNTVRIWGFEPEDLIDDVSDSLWAIVSPQSVAKDVDMKQCLIGSPKDSVVSAFITNSGIVSCRIDSISISGANADQFSVVTKLPPFLLDVNQRHNVEFRFAPTSTGVKTAGINVFTAGGKVNTNIRGEGVAPNLLVENKLIDFGTVKVGEINDTISVTTIKNIGSAPLIITETKHNKPNDKDFSTINGGGSFTLQPGETKKMDLRFKPSAIGRTSGVLEFYHNGIGSPGVIQLFGIGINLTPPRITSNSPLCTGDDLYLFADSIDNAVYSWWGPNGFTSSQQNVVIRKVKAENSGRYFVYATVGGFKTDTSFIDVLVNSQLVTPGDSSFIFVGSAKKIDNYIRLTQAKKWDGGSIWLKNRFSIKKDFETTFQFRYTGGDNGLYNDGGLPGADGIAFVIQNHNYPVLGAVGGSMGYENITNSLAIEVDLWQNEYDPNGNHIAVQSLGALGNKPDHNISGIKLAMNKDIITLQQDSIYYFKIKYEWSKKNLRVFMDVSEQTSTQVINIPNIDLATYLNLEEGEYVYIGFTSGTGDAFEEHDILNWTIPCMNQLMDAEEYKFTPNPEQYSIFPNPAEEFIEIYVGAQGSVPDIRIFNVFGETVKNPTPTLSEGEGLRIDVSGLPSGVYFVRVGDKVMKFLKI